MRFTDPTGHRCVEDGFEGSCESVENKITIKWKKDLADRKRKHTLDKLLEQSHLGQNACDGPNRPMVCTPEPGLELPADYISHTPSETFDGPSTLDEIVQIVDFGAESLKLLDLIEDGVLYGRPLYRQLKYAIPLGGYEYGIDGLLQLYDDRNKNLTPAQSIVRGGVRSLESLFTDGASIGIGTISAAALQAGVPIPGVSAGVGYVVGSYSTSVIIDNAIVNQLNPWLFNRFLGGP